MATITASSSTSSIAATTLVPRKAVGISAPSALGLPSMVRKGKISCSSEKPSASDGGNNMSMGASLVAAVSAAATCSAPALALVDERMTTEGTGLSLGLSNNLLGWILLGVFALIWSLYFVYTSTLEEDEESGLSL